MQAQPTPFPVQTMSETFPDHSAADLAAEMESLTVKDTSMVRTVTIDPAVSTTAGTSSRPSFDQQVCSQDLMMQLQGHSPCDESIKPPKMSLASVCSTSTYNRNSRGSVSYGGNVVPIQSLDFVET